jgi:hypothetical protein
MGLEQFVMQDADGEYTDEFETTDRLEALAYAREHRLKVERIYYVEATSEVIADFTEPELLALARKYRDSPGDVTDEEREELREADLVNASGDLNVAGTELEPWLDEFPVS